MIGSYCKRVWYRIGNRSHDVYCLYIIDRLCLFFAVRELSITISSDMTWSVYVGSSKFLNNRTHGQVETNLL